MERPIDSLTTTAASPAHRSLRAMHDGLSSAINVLWHRSQDKLNQAKAEIGRILAYFDGDFPHDVLVAPAVSDNYERLWALSLNDQGPGSTYWKREALKRFTGKLGMRDAFLALAASECDAARLLLAKHLLAITLRRKKRTRKISEMLDVRLRSAQKAVAFAKRQPLPLKRSPAIH